MATPFYAIRFEDAGGGVLGGGGGEPNPNPHPATGIFTNFSSVQASVAARPPGSRFTLNLFVTRPEAEAYLNEAFGPQHAPYMYNASPASASSTFLSPSQQQQQYRSSYSASGPGCGVSGGGGGGGGGAASSYSGGGGGGDGGGGGEDSGQNLFDAPPGGWLDDTPAARAQPIQTGWLDAELVRSCPGVKLDVLQRRALEEVVVRRNNVFLTGSGGVGKSYVTTLIIKLLKAHYGTEYGKKVCVTASTGIASTHIDGTTLHTATGVGVPRSWDNFGRMFGHDKNVEQRWSKHYEVLFIDEISMLSGEMLEALNDTIQQVRRNMAPFGGLQVIFVGDFAQLPPVPEDPSYTTNDFVRPENWVFPRHREFWHMPVISTGAGSHQQQQQRGYRGGRGPPRQARQEMLFSNRGLALQSDVWWELDLRVIELTKVFRQDDAEFIAALNRMRKGETTPEDLHWLNQQFYYAPLQRDSAQRKEDERREQELLQMELEQLEQQHREEGEEDEYEMEQQYMQMLEDQQQEEGGRELEKKDVKLPLAELLKQEQGQSPSSACAVLKTEDCDGGGGGGGGGGATAAAAAAGGAATAAAIRAAAVQPEQEQGLSQSSSWSLGGGGGGGGATAAGAAGAAAGNKTKEEPLHLYPKNVLVERRNELMLNRLETKEEIFDTHDFVWHEDSGAIVRRGQSAEWFEGRTRRDLQLLLANHTYYKTCLAAEKVKLKLGAKVLLLKNLDLVGPQKLVNGSVGVVVAWAPVDDPFLDEDVTEGEEEEGMEGEDEKEGLDAKEEMALLAALGRGKPANGISPSPAKKKGENDHGLIEYKERVIGDWYAANRTRIPVVLFTNGRRKAICPELFSETIVGVGSTCRIQLPLMIGFAISIHKSQGMTLQEAFVDVQECFDGGQTYVALSRVGPRLGLRLARRLGMDSIKVNPAFLLWNRLREVMERRRGVLLSLLAAHTGPGAKVEARRVEGLGMKGLHEEAVDILGNPARKGEVTIEIRKAWAALKNSLDPLKPGRDERKREVRILHWQCLDWWKARNSERMRALYRSPLPAGAAVGAGGGGLAHG